MPKRQCKPRLTLMLPRIDKRPSGCWLWTGSLSGFGYGIIQWGRHGKQKRALAHRAMYEELVGPPPRVLHHARTCESKLCVNPAHLSPLPDQATHNLAEAAERRATGEPFRCGHPREAGNIYVEGKYQRCRRCRLETNVQSVIKRKKRVAPSQ